MKYKLITKDYMHNIKVTCLCGKCPTDILIEENMKEEFKKMMKWSEEEFKLRTIEIKE